jgi:non-ribosomal peptide synthetase component F
VLSYQALNRAANRVAHALIQRGVRPGHTVGVRLHRSAELVLAMLAVAKAGAAYVPLDPDQPAERLAFMCRRSGVSQLLTVADLAVPEEAAFTLRLDEPAALAGMPEHDPLIERHPLHGAYVCFTSGSTGQPKGVWVPHRAVIRLVEQSDYVLPTPPSTRPPSRSGARCSTAAAWCICPRTS